MPTALSLIMFNIAAVRLKSGTKVGRKRLDRQKSVIRSRTIIKTQKGSQLHHKIGGQECMNFVKRIYKINLFMMIIVIFSASAVHSQTREIIQNEPRLIQAAMPMYPIPALHLGLTGEIKAEVKIDAKGKVISVIFDKGAKVFHCVIEDALKDFVFEESNEKERMAVITFLFTVLPSESKSYVISIFKHPYTIEIFGRKPEVAQSTDWKSAL